MAIRPDDQPEKNISDSPKAVEPDLRADDLLKEGSRKGSTISKKDNTGGPTQGADGSIELSNVFKDVQNGSGPVVEGQQSESRSSGRTEGRAAEGKPVKEETAAKGNTEGQARAREQIRSGNAGDQGSFKLQGSPGRHEQMSPETKAILGFSEPRAGDLGSLKPNRIELSSIQKSNEGTNFNVVGALDKLDHKKPTIAFLDDTRETSVKLDGEKFSHAHVSALTAQKNGMNAFILDHKRNSNGTNLAPALKEIGQRITDGKLPLGQGDVLNVSMGEIADRDREGKAVPGTGDPTFTELNDKFKAFEEKTGAKPIEDINAGNLREKRQEILDRLGEISKDPSDPKWQRKAQQAVDTNNAIKSIQARGVEVAHAAGNDGPDRASIDFLSANHQLSSSDPGTGKSDNFAAKHDLTKSADGVHPIYRDANGRYHMAGVEFSFSDLQALNGSTGSPRRDGENKISFFNQAVTKEELDKTFTGPGPRGEVAIGRPTPPLKTEKGDLVGVVAGTSHSNMPFFKDELPRLRAKKLSPVIQRSSG